MLSSASFRKVHVSLTAPSITLFTKLVLTLNQLAAVRLARCDLQRDDMALSGIRISTRSCGGVGGTEMERFAVLT